MLGAPSTRSARPGSLPGIAGPYDARISPDGKRFAYWFYVQTSYDVPTTTEHRDRLDTGS